MTLVNRVSVFFLIALALALAGYSLVLYVSVRGYLNRQFDDELHSALQVLMASVEVEPDDAKWHPSDHGINLSEAALAKVDWIVCDERGQVVDRSAGLKRGDPVYEQLVTFARRAEPIAEDTAIVGDLRVLQRELAAPNPKPAAIREPYEYVRVRITVGRRQAELAQSLRQLALLVTAAPIVLWLIALGGGRWFVRRALFPVRAMAASVRAMNQADFGPRLVVGPQADELSEFGTAFNHLLDRLQTAFDRERRFTGDAAHQLRTPLAALQVELDVARRRPRSSAEYQQLLDTLARQTGELRQILDSLLYLARSEEDAIRPACQAIELDDWLAAHLARFAEHPRAGDLHLNACSGVSIETVPELLGQLVDNLLSNAMKYSEPGTPVEIGTRCEGDLALLSVRDRGIGISATDQQHIFEPFHRSEEARQRGIPGVGLGLSICARIAAALGGRLQCESERARGTTITLSLPGAGAILKQNLAAIHEGLKSVADTCL
jgi:signal transduction histidine kinase